LFIPPSDICGGAEGSGGEVGIIRLTVSETTGFASTFAFKAAAIAVPPRMNASRRSSSDVGPAAHAWAVLISKMTQRHATNR
jgi:hypothetical protein